MFSCILFVGEDVGRQFGFCCAARSDDVGIVFSAEEELCDEAEGCEHDVWCFWVILVSYQWR